MRSLTARSTRQRQVFSRRAHRQTHERRDNHGNDKSDENESPHKIVIILKNMLITNHSNLWNTNSNPNKFNQSDADVDFDYQYKAIKKNNFTHDKDKKANTNAKTGASNKPISIYCVLVNLLFTSRVMKTINCLNLLGELNELSGIAVCPSNFSILLSICSL